MSGAVGADVGARRLRFQECPLAGIAEPIEPVEERVLEELVRNRREVK